MSDDNRPQGGVAGELMSLDESAPPPDVTSPDAADGQVPATAATGPAVAVEDYNPEGTRKKIAYFLLWIMIGVIVVVVLVALMFSVDCWLNTSRCEPAKDALAMLTSSIAPVFTAMVGLVGSVVGFYFGSKQT